MDPVSELSNQSSMASSGRSSDEKVSEKALIDSMVVLMNSNDCNDDYIQEIQLKCNENVFEFIQITPIEFTFTNTDLLFNALIHVNEWSALCITSKRCVDALQLAISYDHNYNIIDLWIKSNKKVFVVGIKSYEYLKDRLKWEALGSGCGNGDNLAQLMVNEYRDELRSKPVLFPCSQSRSDCLPQSLTSSGIDVKEIVVYQTIANKDLDKEFHSLNNYLIDCLKKEIFFSGLKLIFIYFSPSGLKSVDPFLRHYIINNEIIREQLVVRHIAIGDTTGAALRQSALNVWFTSPKPNPKSLAQTLSENLEILMKTVLRQTLESWLNKNMKIVMTDGRTLVGIFLCTDRDRNVILGSCLEYLKPNEEGTTEEPRVLGLAMIPGQHIVSIHVDNTSLKQ